jgi:hypothetical protein
VRRLNNPASYEDWWNAGIAADAAHGYFGRIWTWVSGICAAWDHTDTARYMGPFDRRTSNPVLVVGNQFDPATPYQGAVTVANLLPNSRCSPSTAGDTPRCSSPPAPTRRSLATSSTSRHPSPERSASKTLCHSARRPMEPLPVHALIEMTRGGFQARDGGWIVR